MPDFSECNKRCLGEGCILRPLIEGSVETEKVIDNFTPPFEDAHLALLRIVHDGLVRTCRRYYDLDNEELILRSIDF